MRVALTGVKVSREEGAPFREEHESGTNAARSMHDGQGVCKAQTRLKCVCLHWRHTPNKNLMVHCFIITASTLVACTDSGVKQLSHISQTWALA